MAVVELDRIIKRYDPRGEPAVRDVSLRVEDGEFMVLLGPSGCGKSTTLRMIAGLESISEGDLRIDDARMNDVPAMKRDIAMVFQSYALYPHMTVRQNMAFGLKRRAMPRDEVTSRVNRTAETLGLTDYLDRKPHALSGGQRQRVALGRAIVRDPKVFLLDEPLSNLDAALRVSTRQELIRQHRALGTTMIYVTHDQIEAMTMGSRICIMNKGEVAQVGRPLEVYSNPADTFVARFLGSPGMNLVPMRRGDDGGVLIGETALDIPDLPGNGPEMLLGIRPEDFYEHDSRPAGLTSVPVEGLIETVEPLGAETLLTFRLPGVEDTLVARVGRDSAARVGDKVPLQMDVNAVRFFDQGTGISITQGYR